MANLDIWSGASQEPPRYIRAVWVAAYLCFIGINVASGVGWLGATNAEISSKFSTPLTPAGWAFSIWGLIFLLEGAGTLHQALADYDSDGTKARFTNAVGPWWVGSWLAACAWQLAFVQQTPGGMWLALLFILLSLAFMAVALRNLLVLRAEHGPAPTLLLYAAYFLPTSINTAWLSVASAVQVLICMLGQEHAQLDAPAVLLASAVVAGGAFVCLRYLDTAFGLTLIWALVAVFEQSASTAVQRTAIAGIVVTGLCTLVSVLRRRSAGTLSSADLQVYQPLITDP